jgi:hypothetical protein
MYYKNKLLLLLLLLLLLWLFYFTPMSTGYPVSDPRSDLCPLLVLLLLHAKQIGDQMKLLVSILLRICTVTRWCNVLQFRTTSPLLMVSWCA